MNAEGEFVGLVGEGIRRPARRGQGAVERRWGGMDPQKSYGNSTVKFITLQVRLNIKIKNTNPYSYNKNETTSHGTRACDPSL